jgi:hypothetical protein
MRYTQPTEEHLIAWDTWLAERPEALRVCVAKYKLDPWTLYRLKPTGQRVFIVALYEPGEDGKVTLRVGVSGEFNLLTFERDVFGIDPADLEECDLPNLTEQIGTLDLPFEVVKGLRDRYPDGTPQNVMLDLIAGYPLKRGGHGR